MLYRCYRFLNTSARLALVKSVIQPDMDYGAVIWNNGSAQVANRLNRIEKRYLRVLEGLSYRDRTSMVGGVSSLLNKFGIRSVKCRQMLHLGRLVQPGILDNRDKKRTHGTVYCDATQVTRHAPSTSF